MWYGDIMALIFFHLRTPQDEHPGIRPLEVVMVQEVASTSLSVSVPRSYAAAQLRLAAAGRVPSAAAEAASQHPRHAGGRRAL